MRRTALFVSLLVVCTPFGALTQQWSAEQQEVWQTVEAYAEAFATGDLEEFLSFFHEDFSGWDINDAVPRNREYVEKAVSRAVVSQQVLWYHLSPLVIQVFDDVAVVHYYVTWNRQSVDGAESKTQARWTDVLVRSGNRWMMVADHGGTVTGG